MRTPKSSLRLSIQPRYLRLAGCSTPDGATLFKVSGLVNPLRILDVLYVLCFVPPLTHSFPMIAPTVSSPSVRLQVELELLQTLFPEMRYDSQDEIPYPWNPAEPDAEACLTALEQAFSLEDWSVEETSQRSQMLFGQLEQCWHRTDLSLKFAAIPTALLDALVERAKQAIEQSATVAERLVGCVRDLFPDWNEADLHVLARPFAYAMRDGSDFSSIASGLDWSSLSEVERARLSLAAANYLLTQLSNPIQE